LRGRIYRTGIWHFHERDFARSLILFSTPQQTNETTSNVFLELLNLLYCSIANHYQSLKRDLEALEWFKTHCLKYIHGIEERSWESN
jgi:DNA-directed RNA polymerase